MKAEELRIGNYLTFKGSSRVNVKLDRFDLSAILYNEDEVLHYEPIKLTEEILLKCGFKHTGNGFYEFLGKFVELCNIGNEFFTTGYKGVSIGKIKHLHQLQNLYWCLTNEELQIDLQ